MRASALSISPLSVAAHLTAIALSSVILISVLDLWNADLRIPLSYGGDSLLCGSLIKGIIDNGWYLHNVYVGAPDGQYLYDYPVNANLDIIIMKIISVFCANYAITMNIYFLLTFILTTITTMFVLRNFKTSYPLSILGSLLFSFVPYHFLRGEPHLTLAAYYMIPPIIMVIHWVFISTSFLLISSENNISGLRRLSQKSIMCIVICVLISSTFIYYPFFSCFFLLIAGISGYISPRSKYPLLNSIILILIIIIGVLANASPSLIYQYENGKNPEVAIRGPAESEIYGLKIVQLLMPIGGHRIQLFSRLAGYYSGTAPLINENAIVSLGVLGSLGFLLLMGWAFYRISNGLKLKAENALSLINELSILNISAILLATLGGFGSLFAYLIFPEIRCYNRISIFIAFFSLFAVVLVLDALSRKYAKSHTSRFLFNAFICIVLIFGILDQTSSSFVPPYASTRAEYLNDELFVNNIDALMPENAMIFQLPYVPFPEYPPINRMSDYSHFKAYLHSKDLRWSYGAMKGRQTDAWQRLVASMPVEDMLRTLSQTGFAGLYIDSYGYQDNGDKLIADIKQVLGVEPLVSGDKRLYFFDMTKYNGELKADSPENGNIKIAYNSGWQDQEDWAGIPTRWMQADSEIVVFSPENRTSTLSMGVQSFYRSRTLMISSGDSPVAQIFVPTSFINASVPISLEKGANIVHLHVPEGCERPCDMPELNNADSRFLSVAMQNLDVEYNNTD